MHPPGNSQDGYRQTYSQNPSTESYGQGTPPAGPYQGSYDRSGADSPNFTDYESSSAHGAPYSRLREPYPAWSNEQQIPLSKEEIEDVFIDLANKFGFQVRTSAALPGSSGSGQLTPTCSCLRSATRCATCTTTS